jgi:hypothetical protein
MVSSLFTALALIAAGQIEPSSIEETRVSNARNGEVEAASVTRSMSRESRTRAEKDSRS